MPTNGTDTNKQRADAYRAEIEPTVRSLRSKGLSLQAIADCLNGRGLRTRQGKPFSEVAIHRILGRTGHAARF
jgi:hypothetical protein